MKKNHYYFLVTVVLLLTHLNLFAQYKFETTPNKASTEVMQNINSQMTNKYDGTFGISSYFVMDSLVNKSESPDWQVLVTDPYGTLRGVSIFSCSKDVVGYEPDSTIIGIYKNNMVVWDSGPIIFGDITSYLAFSRDINKDGKVDIGIKAEYSPPYPRAEAQLFLWIISWNGHSGEIINDYDKNTHKSEIISGPFDLFDQTGDGIYEIESDSSMDPEVAKLVTYGWNGEKYGKWASVYQLKFGDYYPAIWIKPTIHSKVTKDNNLLKFQYSIHNDSSSEQTINRTYISGVSISDITKTSKRGSFASFEDVWLFSTYGHASLIKPGKTQKGYWYEGNGLPGICTAYLRGQIPLELTRSNSDEWYREEVYKNSVIKKTIGLISIPQKLDTLKFLDTLISYTNQAYSLKWFKGKKEKNDKILDKLLKNLNNAHTELEKGKIKKVKKELEKFVKTVEEYYKKSEKEKSKGEKEKIHFTSEAYALLKYNAEYLIEHIKNNDNEDDDKDSEN